MPSERDSSPTFVEMGRTEHEILLSSAACGKFPHVLRLGEWGGSPHYCASSVPELAEEIDSISKLGGGGAGTKIESILLLVREAERTGAAVSVSGGGGVSSGDVSPITQSFPNALIQEPRR